MRFRDVDDLVAVADADAEPAEQYVQIAGAEESPELLVGGQGAQEALVVPRSPELELPAID